MVCTVKDSLFHNSQFEVQNCLRFTFEASLIFGKSWISWFSLKGPLNERNDLVIWRKMSENSWYNTILYAFYTVLIKYQEPGTVIMRSLVKTQTRQCWRPYIYFRLFLINSPIWGVKTAKRQYWTSAKLSIFWPHPSSPFADII